LFNSHVRRKRPSKDIDSLMANPFLRDDGWYDLTPFWEWLEFISRKIHAQKDPYASTRPWNLRSHLIGNCGEFTLTLATGEMFDYKLHNGQGKKADFQKYETEVKTSEFYVSPQLKHPKDESRWAKYFELVALDEKRKRSKIMGWCTAQELKNGFVHDFGNGPQRVLEDFELHPGLPPTWPYKI